ncbi:MAG TPA: M20/M25/M40 family metallo-hydrolase [Verrucomicrobiae bacterium]|nr:M20/M25/M40 family metallo-hydrolase [Verrucomicrobiae bacterium]
MAANVAGGVNLGELAEHRGVRDGLQWFTREKQWINETHLQLCRVPSPTFLEQERAAWLLEQLRALGWSASVDRSGNVVAADGDGPYVALTAHLDTVIAPRKDEITVDSDGRFRGPGVSDNGAGLAALLAVARAWKSGLALPARRCGLLLVGNVGEEGEGNLLGMRHLCKQSPFARKIESFLVVDGANTEHITSRALGSRRFEVAFTGAGGHSWSDFGAGNPVHALCRAVALFSETRIDPGPPKSAINVGLIEGGSSINAIAQLARAKVDIRSESNEKVDELAEILLAAVDRARDLENQRATAGKVSVKVKEIGSRPAAALPDTAPILQYIRAVDAHLGIRSHLDTSSTDANIPLSLGLPAISIGGGGVGGGAHTSQEWFRPEGRDLGLKRIFLTLLLLMRNESANGGHPR